MGKKGLSLLETVFAVGLFSTFAIAIAGVWSVHHSALSQSSNRLMATFIAQQEVNRAIALGYSNLSVGNSTTQTVSLDTKSHGVAGKSLFSYQTQIQEDPATHFRQVTVSVSWHEATGDKNLAYTTFLHQTAENIKVVANQKYAEAEMQQVDTQLLQSF